jgi:hypothetical protein
MIANWGGVNASAVQKESASKESDTSTIRADTESADESQEASQAADVEDADTSEAGGQDNPFAERKEKRKGARIGREEILDVMERSFVGCEFGDVMRDESINVMSCTIKLDAWMRPLIALLGHLRARVGESSYMYLCNTYINVCIKCAYIIQTSEPSLLVEQDRMYNFKSKQKTGTADACHETENKKIHTYTYTYIHTYIHTFDQIWKAAERQSSQQTTAELQQASLKQSETCASRPHT